MFIKETLKERYNDAFLEAAEIKRTNFKYTSIDLLSERNSRLEHINELLYQTHQAYYFGFNNTVCTMCGVILEQCVIYLLDNYASKQGYLSIYRNNEVVDIETIDELVSYNLITLIGSAKYFNLFNNSSYNSATILRLLRNGFIHDIAPDFKAVAGYYSSSFNGLNINIDEDEINSALACNGKEANSKDIWSYFMLKETRTFLESVFDNIEYVEVE